MDSHDAVDDEGGSDRPGAIERCKGVSGGGSSDGGGGGGVGVERRAPSVQVRFCLNH